MQENLEERFEKNEVEWTGRVEFRKEEIPGSERSIHGHTATHTRRTFEDWVLNTGDLNFCVHGSPLRGVKSVK